jgi:GntR family transcriptional regulator, galactonate operon transcriptional repressor
MKDATPIHRGMSLVDQVVHRIGQSIVSGEFVSGSSLPNETEWCEQLEVSRSVLREALRVLVSKNMISIRVRRGGRIREQVEWNLLDPDILLWRSLTEDPSQFAAELFELRRFIEPEAASLAATRIQDVQLEELERACRAMEMAGEDTARYFEPDTRFHRTILDAVGNSLFRGLTQSIMVALEMTLRMSLNPPRGLQQSVPLHLNVYRALLKRDPGAARLAMMQLIDASARDVAEAQTLVKQPRARAGRGRTKRKAVRRG